MTEDNKAKTWPSDLDILKHYLGVAANVFEEYLTENVEVVCGLYQDKCGKGLKKFFCKNLDDVFNEMAAHKNYCMALEENGLQQALTMQFPIELDGSNFTKDELATVANEFKAIHDIGLKYNVDISFDGFDNMPRKVTGTRGGYADNRCILISLNTSRPYSVYTHPDFDGKNDMQLKERLNSFKRLDI